MGTPQAATSSTDLANGTLPNYAFIAPNNVNDTHDDQPATSPSATRISRT